MSRSPCTSVPFSNRATTPSAVFSAPMNRIPNSKWMSLRSASSRSAPYRSPRLTARLTVPSSSFLPFATLDRRLPLPMK